MSDTAHPSPTALYLTLINGLQTLDTGSIDVMALTNVDWFSSVEDANETAIRLYSERYPEHEVKFIDTLDITERALRSSTKAPS